jgi:DNA polymerase III alpha subunit
MRTDKYGQIVLDKDEIFAGLYSGKLSSLSEFFTDDIELVTQLNTALRSNYDQIPQVKLYTEGTVSKEIFDQNNQQSWFMPKEYQNFDIETWIVKQCNTDTSIERAQTELVLFRQHNMIDLLKYIKYLVDTMREHKIVWGVGRGSSVASYVLFLIGVHKIDSIKYKLDINEFLR